MTKVRTGACLLRDLEAVPVGKLMVLLLFNNICTRDVSGYIEGYSRGNGADCADVPLPDATVRFVELVAVVRLQPPTVFQSFSG